MSTIPIVPKQTAVLLIDHQEGLLQLSKTTDVASLRTTGGRKSPKVAVHFYGPAPMRRTGRKRRAGM